MTNNRPKTSGIPFNPFASAIFSFYTRYSDCHRFDRKFILLCCLSCSALTHTAIRNNTQSIESVDGNFSARYGKNKWTENNKSTLTHTDGHRQLLAAAAAVTAQCTIRMKLNVKHFWLFTMDSGTATTTITTCMRCNSQCTNTIWSLVEHIRCFNPENK